MERLTIHSRLDSFQLLGSLSEVTPESIYGTTRIDRAPMFAYTEAMAQLAAMHVRYLVEFKCHAFLLKVAHCQVSQCKPMEGDFDLQAELLNHSSNAFAYNVKARGDAHKRIDAELLIGIQAYDGHFKKELLQAHYQNRFKCLQNRGA